MNWVEILYYGLAGYSIVGAVFSVAFVTRGVGVVDENARGATVGFRCLIFPGSVALWPLMLRRWVAANSKRTLKQPENTDAA